MMRQKKSGTYASINPSPLVFVSTFVWERTQYTSINRLANMNEWQGTLWRSGLGVP